MANEVKEIKDLVDQAEQAIAKGDMKLAETLKIQANRKRDNVLFYLRTRVNGKLDARLDKIEDAISFENFENNINKYLKNLWWNRRKTIVLIALGIICGMNGIDLIKLALMFIGL